MFSFQTMDVNTIISEALQLIRAESVYQDENQDARMYILNILNDILYLISAGGEYEPYYKIFSFNLTTSVSTYIIGTSPAATVVLPRPMASIDYVTLIINGYQYPIIIQDNFGNLNNSRPLTVGGRPAWVWILPGQDEFRLQFFPVPNLDYTCQLLYKDTTTPVKYQDTVALPPAYRALLIYWLGKRANSQGGYGSWSPENEANFVEINTTLKSIVAKDYRIRSYPPYSNNPGWYTYNLGVIST